MQGAAIRILLVEDDDRDYALTREFLAEAHVERFDLDRAASFAAALAAVSAREYDLVLLDLCLPDSKGWPTFERMRDHAPQAAIVLLTGLDDESVANRAMQEGAQDFLIKGQIEAGVLSRAIRYSVSRKRVELSLKHYQEHLEELVEDRTTELSWANTMLQREIAERRATEEQLKRALQQLQEHSQAKSDFVTNVSHDLRTPLTCMTYAIGNLLRGVSGPLPERVRTYLMMMADDCTRLIGTVNDVLDAGRIDAKQLRLNFCRVAFASLVRRAAQPLHFQAEGKMLTLDLDLDEGAGFVLCDAQRMERVVHNIVGNAIKFTPEGGAIEIAVHRVPENPPRLRLQVTDNGIGIAAEHLSRVTERYFRGGEFATGSGLGLSLCKDLIHMHSGTLNVVSPPPGRLRGTQVTAEFPAAPPLSVLALDRAAGACGSVRSQLSPLGFRIECCADSRRLMDTLSPEMHDIVVVNTTEPGGEGLAMVGRIRSNPRFGRIPIVLVTSSAPVSGQSDMLRQMGVPLVTRPCSTADLVGCLEQAVTQGLSQAVVSCKEAVS